LTLLLLVLLPLLPLMLFLLQLLLLPQGAIEFRLRSLAQPVGRSVG